VESGDGAVTRVAQVEAALEDAAVATPDSAVAGKEGPGVETILSVVVGVVDDIFREARVVPTIVHLPPVGTEHEIIVNVIPRRAIIRVETLRCTAVASQSQRHKVRVVTNSNKNTQAGKAGLLDGVSCHNWVLKSFRTSSG
jgi:hypothetical protein